MLNEGKSLVPLNVTNIVLIPKISSPTNIVKFKPISLCTVLYKVIVKMVGNSFQKVLEDCIDGAQSSFVLGHLISDNILLAYEILHSFQQKGVGKKGWMTLKLDMSKAYDHVDWDFLKLMMD